jgi:hypothetical protein
MVDTLQEVLIVVGVGGLGVLWAAAIVGMLQIGWSAIAGPVKDRFKDRD